MKRLSQIGLYFSSILVLIVFTAGSRSPEYPSGVGASINPTGFPIGGGSGYARLAVSNPSDRISSREELITALNTADSGAVIHLDPESKFDMTGLDNLSIPGHVTVSGGRGDNTPGALIFTRTESTSGLFVTQGPNVRITGIRLAGPDTSRRTEQLKGLLDSGGHEAYYTVPLSRGISASHAGLQVDNCEILGWNHAGIRLVAGATDAHIHHNSIHHCQRYGLGYGICLDEATAIIEANEFDWCRHAIASTGNPGSAYVARYNLVRSHANGHSFDMHGGADRKDGTDIAGDYLHIHHNTFEHLDHPAIIIRGKPLRVSRIHNNRFGHPTGDQAIIQSNATGNLRIFDNEYTSPAGAAPPVNTQTQE